MVNFAPLPPKDPRLFTTPPERTTVLVVGAGPAGLLSSCLLARRGIPSIVIERHDIRLNQPKAHAINPRSLEILRQAGFDTAALRKLGSSAEDAFWVRFNTGLTGYELGMIPYERQDKAVKEVTPEPLFNIAQPKLESFLQEAALKSGLVTIHRGWQWEDVQYEDDGRPVSKIRNRSADGHVLRIKSQYVIGADGGESTVRSKIGAEWIAPGGKERPKNFYRSVHCKGDLRKIVGPTNKFAELYFCLHPEHRSGLIIYDLDNSWVHAHPIDPHGDSVGTITAEKCRELVRSCVGPEVDFEVQSVNIWYTFPRISSTYQSGNNRVFLCGDSAHIFPPQGGLGVNTGIADVHNLVWKLASVLNGQTWNATYFLASYTAERKAVATANALQSAENEDIWINFNAYAGKCIDHAVDSGSDFKQFFESEPIRSDFSKAMALNEPHFDSLGLQLGYIYGSDDGTKLIPNCAIYEPSATPGARLPHAWLKDGRSTLDLVPEDKFVVFHSHDNFSSSNFTFAINPVQIVAIDVQKLEVDPNWKQLLGLYRGEGVLVRPDQHVLALVSSTQDLEEAVRKYVSA